MGPGNRGTYLGDDDIDLLDWELDIFEFTL